jgi:hypothetical protein
MALVSSPGSVFVVQCVSQVGGRGDVVGNMAAHPRLAPIFGGASHFDKRLQESTKFVLSPLRLWSRLP